VSVHRYELWCDGKNLPGRGFGGRNKFNSSGGVAVRQKLSSFRTRAKFRGWSGDGGFGFADGGVGIEEWLDAGEAQDICYAGIQSYEREPAA
jgi:hypothetical protein